MAASSGAPGSSSGGAASSGGMVVPACSDLRGTRFGVCAHVGVPLPPTRGTRFGLEQGILTSPAAPAPGNRFGITGEVVIDGP
ncbi:MAG: hypothetical protein HY904_04280 [Deltaproteobacteria bacterium]|nr:hypothetical protein [Deltaproteobacteria bacterium]